MEGDKMAQSVKNQLTPAQLEFQKFTKEWEPKRMVAAAIEHRSDGFVLGVEAKMFEIAGVVIVYGVFATFVVAVVKIARRAWGGG
jgi:hypothetical protein